MKPVFTFDEIREVEKTIIEKDGIPSLLLMENAGKNTFDVICTKFPDIDDYDIYIFCGKGNNAGDGFVIARHMAMNSINVNVVNLADPADMKGDALVNFNMLSNLYNEKVRIVSFKEFTRAESKSLSKSKNKVLILDALLGSGIKGVLDGDFPAAIELINSVSEKNKNVNVISVDVPSGLMSGEQVNPVICSDATVTMGAVKNELLYGEGKENSGEIFVVPIGVSENLLSSYNTYGKYIFNEDDIAEIFLLRKKTSYKYSNGRALLIGGSKGMSGALIMSSLAAVKSGCGGVTAAFPESLSTHFGRKLYDVIKLELGETPEGTIKSSYSDIKKKIDKADSVLIGPGISLNNETKSFVFDVIKNCDRNLVIDADALTLLAEDMSVLAQRKDNTEIILTPHIGEFSKMSGLSADEITSNRFNAVREFAVKYKVNVVLKSETTLICLANGEIYINTMGNETLASAGSGDVLSGIIISLLAQTKNAKTAMLAGCYVHGMLAEMYFDEYGNKQTAAQRDLIKYIPKAVTNILKRKNN